MTVAPGWRGLTAHLLLEVCGAAGKGQRWENSLPCPVAADIAPEKAHLLPGDNDVKNILVGCVETNALMLHVLWTGELSSQECDFRSACFDSCVIPARREEDTGCSGCC